MSVLYKRIYELLTQGTPGLDFEIAVDKNGESKATKILLSVLSGLIDADIRNDIISDTLPIARRDKTIEVDNDDYSVTANDGSCIIYVITGAVDRTITINTECLISGIKIKIIKVDSGSGHVTVATEGAEKIYNQRVDFDTIGLWLQNEFIEIEPDYNNAYWIKTNSPYIHLLDESDRNSSWDLDVNPSTSLTECDLSGSVPPGTLALYGHMEVVSNDEIGVLNLRDASSSETDATRIRGVRIGDVGTSGIYNGRPVTIKATNGKFDYADVSSYTMTVLKFLLWGWQL